MFGQYPYRRRDTPDPRRTVIPALGGVSHCAWIRAIDKDEAQLFDCDWPE
jgi:hypothetical protein